MTPASPRYSCYTNARALRLPLHGTAATPNARDRERPATRPPRRRAGERPRELAQLDARVAHLAKDPRPDLPRAASPRPSRRRGARPGGPKRAEAAPRSRPSGVPRTPAAIERKDRETVTAAQGVCRLAAEAKGRSGKAATHGEGREDARAMADGDAGSTCPSPPFFSAVSHALLRGQEEPDR